MKLIDIDVLLKEIEDNYDCNYGETLIDPRHFYDLVDEQHVVCKWHEIKTKADLPKEQGYYLVAIERYKDWETKEKEYYTNFIFFRGKTTWATCNGSIKAWMELPEEFKK
jgi:hypothetical protein